MTDDMKESVEEADDDELEYQMASKWNTKIIEQKIAEQLDEQHLIVHSTYKSFNSPYKFRDFVTLDCLRCEQEVERYFLLYASICNYDNLPEFKGRDRTVVLPSGFDIRPTQQNANRSHVSYRSIMTAGSISLVSADLLLESDELFQSILNIDRLITENKQKLKSKSKSK
jgi:hypothetical protein